MKMISQDDSAEKRSTSKIQTKFDGRINNTSVFFISTETEKKIIS